MPIHRLFNQIFLGVVGFGLAYCPFECAFSKEATAPVSGFAISFWSGERIPHAKITVLETGQILETTDAGTFSLQYPVGKPITLLFQKSGYITTQSGTFNVPENGLTGPYDNITFQVPSIYIYFILKRTVGGKEDPNSCHVTSTVLAYHKTLDDVPQGELGATVKILPEISETPFYFDIFTKGPWKGKTYPFPTGLSSTSLDGGIAYFNITPREEPYRLIAQKDGVVFNEAQFLCRKGAFINISPPGGPMAQKKLALVRHKK